MYSYTGTPVFSVNPTAKDKILKIVIFFATITNKITKCVQTHYSEMKYTFMWLRFMNP